MLIPLHMTIAGCLISAIVGYLASSLFDRRRGQTTGPKAEAVSVPEMEKAESRSEAEIERLVSSLYELSSQVDSQVGQHSLKVSEITNSLNDSSEGGSSTVAVAGKLLITANQKLQADLEEAKTEIQRQRDQMNSHIRESRTDQLTGLSNRRALDLEMDRIFAQRRRDGSTFSVIIMDIDHFKRVNDHYGHMVGDRLLKCFSRCLTNTFRETDFVARFGGEEFVAVLPKTTLEAASKAAERLRSLIGTTMHKVGDVEIKMSASFGVKEIGEGESWEEILQKADAALYAAKNGGRNQCFYHDGNQCLKIVLEPEAPVKDATVDQSSEESPELVSVVHDAGSRTSTKASSLGNVDKNVQ